MIQQSKYIARQMNGPVINSFFQALETALSDSVTITDYLKKLSIDNSNETEAESIGCLIGYPRPLVPEGFNEENILLIGSLPLESDSMIGLSSIDSEIGGHLSTTQESDTGYMAIGTYKKMLQKVALLKRYGVTLESVDEIASLISSNYTLEWTSDNDILINYGESVGYKNVWILTQLFSRIATAPQVFVSSGD